MLSNGLPNVLHPGREAHPAAHSLRAVAADHSRRWWGRIVVGGGFDGHRQVGDGTTVAREIALQDEEGSGVLSCVGKPSCEDTFAVPTACVGWEVCAINDVHHRLHRRGRMDLMDHNQSIHSICALSCDFEFWGSPSLEGVPESTLPASRTLAGQDPPPGSAQLFSEGIGN